MLHLFKHTKGKLKGKFDIALVVKGRYLVGSKQGYNRVGDALNLMKHFDSLLLQDDTVTPSVVYRYKPYNPNVSSREIANDIKPSKPYQPK